MKNDSSKSNARCPLCGGESSHAFEVHGHDLFDCETCDHRFASVPDGKSHVASVYDDSYFNGGGAGYSDYLAEAEMLRSRGQMYADKISSIIDKPGRILDIGCAAGCILKGFEDAGWSGVGLEPNVQMAELAKTEYGLNVMTGALEDFETEEPFDLVSMIQVAGHFYDPSAAFKKAYEVLKPDGFLLIETWNRESFSARMFGKNWHEYSPPSVLQFWSKKGLTQFLETIGFKNTAGGRPSKKISGKHAHSLLEYKLGTPALGKLIPKGLNIPYPSEDLFWGLYQKVSE